ncbi:MAG: hypothetical protein LDL41_07495 [Coleofasciculus sp. S288]|nr:hypothetical protein [Coleofasciculus sp. S288]
MNHESWQRADTDEQLERLRRPWAIARLGAANEKTRIVSRFANQQDAADYLRVLNRLMRLKLQEFDTATRPQFVVVWDGVKLAPVQPSHLELHL